MIFNIFLFNFILFTKFVLTIDFKPIPASTPTSISFPFTINNDQNTDFNLLRVNTVRGFEPVRLNSLPKINKGETAPVQNFFTQDVFVLFNNQANTCIVFTLGQTYGLTVPDSTVKVSEIINQNRCYPYAVYPINCPSGNFKYIIFQFFNNWFS